LDWQAPAKVEKTGWSVIYQRTCSSNNDGKVTGASNAGHLSKWLEVDFSSKVQTSLAQRRRTLFDLVGKAEKVDAHEVVVYRLALFNISIG
jgi:hypothetical protein